MRLHGVFGTAPGCSGGRGHEGKPDCATFALRYVRHAVTMPFWALDQQFLTAELDITLRERELRNPEMPGFCCHPANADALVARR